MVLLNECWSPNNTHLGHQLLPCHFTSLNQLSGRSKALALLQLPRRPTIKSAYPFNNTRPILLRLMMYSSGAEKDQDNDDGNALLFFSPLDSGTNHFVIAHSTDDATEISTGRVDLIAQIFSDINYGTNSTKLHSSSLMSNHRIFFIMISFHFRSFSSILLHIFNF